MQLGLRHLPEGLKVREGIATKERLALRLHSPLNAECPMTLESAKVGDAVSFFMDAADMVAENEQRRMSSVQEGASGKEQENTHRARAKMTHPAALFIDRAHFLTLLVAEASIHEWPAKGSSARAAGARLAAQAEWRGTLGKRTPLHSSARRPLTVPPHFHAPSMRRSPLLPPHTLCHLLYLALPCPYFVFRSMDEISGAFEKVCWRGEERRNTGE